MGSSILEFYKICLAWKSNFILQQWHLQFSMVKITTCESCEDGNLSRPLDL